MRWTGLTCLVTGASSGLGAEMARALARRGAVVIAIARREDRLRSLVEDLGGDPHSYLVCDVSNLDDVRTMAGAASERAPHLDVLVNNAGVPSSGPFLESSSEQIEQVLRTNLLGPVWCTKELLPLLQAADRRSRTPVVVNVASMAGRIPSPATADYTAAKFGLVGFTEAVWSELGSEQIRTMMLNPALTRTEGFPMTDVLANSVGKHFVMDASRVARALVRGIEKGSFEVHVQWWMHPLYIGTVLMGPLRRAAARGVRRSVGNMAAETPKHRR